MHRIGRRLATTAFATCLFAITPSADGADRSTALDHQRLRSIGSKPYREAVVAFLDRSAPKIVPGEIAAERAYPWQVSLGVSWIVDPRAAHFCGGTIYSPSWLVTAAHCVVDTRPEDIAVTAGTNRLSPGARRYNIGRIVVHRDYDASTSDRDIALVELLDPLMLDETMRAIPLLQPADEDAVLVDDAPLQVSGWGAMFEGGRAVEELRFAVVPFVARDTCNRPLAYDGQITENMICAGALEGGVDSCQGDSGGPLVLPGQAPVLAGAVSWGIGCARPNKVGVYTRISRFAGWVETCVQHPDTCNQ
ncbi:MAG TPA: serine protease [Thermoanaerobaculia bacterium]|nr:serine protease [Thermoanaerobaculia bacterium]